MEITKLLRLSVHTLVDFMLRRGDIDNRIFNKASMQMGTKLHKLYQAAQTEAFIAEQFLRHTYEVDEYAVTIEGYADGIRELLNKVYIEEVKTTVAGLNAFADQHQDWHRMQALLYGHMYAEEHGLETIRIRLIYINQADETTLIRSYENSRTDVGEAIVALIKDYLAFYRLVDRHLAARQQSVAALSFPFKAFRPGQREMAKYVYSLAQNGGTLLVEAPTGIGKTISALYPSILALGSGIPGKIFYMTAKNSGHEAAVTAVAQLRKKGADVSEIVLTAKDKICLTPGAACNPDECPFAKGYYDKIRGVLTEALSQHTSFNRELILRYAQANEICPFEFQLDLSLFVDIVIGDYNYVFDPMVYLRRFFDTDASGHFLLVDEAHNLVERSRSMYSATITSISLKKMRRSVRAIKHAKFKRTITRLTKLFKDEYEEEAVYPKTCGLDRKWLTALDAFLIQAQDVMRKFPAAVDEPFKDFYFDANRFYKLSDFYDEHFVYYKDRLKNGDLSMNLFCLDSSELLAKTMKQVKGRVLFSATLAPLDYYVPMLGGQTDDPVLRLPSPFPRNNLLLMVAPKISTRFKSRSGTLDEIALYIELAIQGKVGNYLVFFPSYKYMNEVRGHMKTDASVEILVQDPEMTLDDQAAFLDHFVPAPEHTMVGFVVLGGPFAEGIDLIEDRLIGSIIVGVGLPQLSFERDLIKDFFNRHDSDGYSFSYAYPGMNRVMQAVGRVIRSEKDRGIALLIDDRYLEARYRNMFKSEWSHYEAVITPDDLQALVNDFWNAKRN
jgi:DNA excision repair protein ERCC-2